MERKFGLNYGLSPFEVRRAPWLKGSFEVLTKVLLYVLFYITRSGIVLLFVKVPHWFR